MPGPPAVFCPVFPADFLEEARQAACRRTIRFQLRQRAELVLLLHQYPRLSNVAAGNRVGLHLDSVRHWRRRWAGGDLALEDLPGRGRQPVFSPLDEAVIQASACETVCATEVLLRRQSLSDLTGRARQALGKPVSKSTVWRILNADAIKPWQCEHWIFPRDPRFAAKAGRVVDRYAGWWEGERLDPEDRILSSDEKTSIQARSRCHGTLGPASRCRRRLEHEYERGGALPYLAVWGIQDGIVLGHCEAKTGIAPFGRLVRQVMERPEYAQATRVFWVVDNGSSHRGAASVQRRVRA